MIFDLLSALGGFPMPPPERKFFVPEVVQTSAMDCGPATLKALLEGFGIPISYGRLREACQTDVDGTSIDVMEETAIQLGLEAEQVMIPADHLLLPESQILPAIVVVRQPNGLTHFVVVWSQHGSFLQVMDPSTGRHWLSSQRFLSELYSHSIPVPASAWREWAGSEGFCDPLRQRLINIGIEEQKTANLIKTVLVDPSWHSLAGLDAVTRMVAAIVRADGLIPGQETEKMVEHLLAKIMPNPSADREKKKEEEEQIKPVDKYKIIPAPYWSVQPIPADPNQPNELNEEEQILMQGAVLVRVTGLRQEGKQPEQSEEGEETEVRPISPELIAALEEGSKKPGFDIIHLLRTDGLLTPFILSAALFLASLGVIIEALLMRGILNIGLMLELTIQRVGAMVVLFIFVILLFLLELPLASTAMRMGRRLETRLWMAFLSKIPRLSDRYFHSRLTSDMTERAHSLRQLRILPRLGISFLRLSFQIILTAIGVAWIEPRSAPLAFLATFFAVGLSFVSQPLLAERDLRLRTHIGALGRFYLDSLLGLIPIRTHRAERSVRREHENLMVEWAYAAMEFYNLDTIIQTTQAIIGSIFAVWILFNYVSHSGEISGILLLFYWTLSLPLLGQALANVTQQYPMHRNRVLRMLELLNAPDDDIDKGLEDKKAHTKTKNTGIAIKFKQVMVKVSGQIILPNININIEAGEHVAIVGTSGAGKSSMVGLLLGWHKATIGQVLIDGEPLAEYDLWQLRRESVWVDPAVQLWNRSLLKNIDYGTKSNSSLSISQAIEQADLFAVLERLPDGLQTKLGEGGGLVSGGEGQRVRLGRAMFRPGVRLALLDEPFRGLDREQRKTLLARARQHWAKSTLICVTHDVSETLTFERVLVIEQGEIIEDANPKVLATQPGSRYKTLLDAEEMVRKNMWNSTGDNNNLHWRKLWLEGGRLEERA